MHIKYTFHLYFSISFLKSQLVCFLAYMPISNSATITPGTHVPLGIILPNKRRFFLAIPWPATLMFKRFKMPLFYVDEERSERCVT